MKVYGCYLRYMKVYEGIWKYMEVYEVYPDILKNLPSLARSIARFWDQSVNNSGLLSLIKAYSSLIKAYSGLIKAYSTLINLIQA